ncbi:MAG: hypothetical protein QOD10_5997, partial [Mycobacterium sp.]|nr:hypothetical protein [Mycobacterium sp.]
FVVVAAEAPAVGIEALPGIESKLRGRDVYSACRLQPDMQVGIVHVKSERRLDEILGLVSRLTTNRVGVSARFDDLQDTPQALHFAKVMLRGRPDEASPVAVFDGSILATAAVSAPDVMVKSIGNVLAGFDDLPDDERQMLCETFRVWQDNDALSAQRRRGAHLPSQHRAPSTAPDREIHRPIPFAPKGCRRTMFGFRSTPLAHVTRGSTKSTNGFIVLPRRWVGPAVGVLDHPATWGATPGAAWIKRRRLLLTETPDRDPRKPKHPQLGGLARGCSGRGTSNNNYAAGPWGSPVFNVRNHQ